MAEPVVYSVNEVVGYKDRLCLITAITKTQAGFNRYTLEDIDSEDAFLAHKHELARAQDVIVVGAFGEELFTDQPGQVQGTVEPPAAAKQSTRFADLTEEEVDRLAEARTSKNTNIQTKWGVKIMTGNLLTSQLSKWVWVSKWMKIFNGFKWYMNTYFGWDGDLRNVILKL